MTADTAPPGRSDALLSPSDALLSPSDVAELFRVSSKTVVRWVKLGKLHAAPTLGGHRRLYASEVNALLDQHTLPAQPHPARRRTQHDGRPSKHAGGRS